MLNDDINLFLGVFSYPFCHVDFLKNDILDTFYSSGSSSKKETDRLRQMFLGHLKNKYYVSSYDEVFQYLQNWYLDAQLNATEVNPVRNSFDAIWHHLKCFEKAFITQRDGRLVYKYWEHPEDDKFLGGFAQRNKIYLFHSLNRLMPLDILTAVYLTKNGKDIRQLEGFYGNIAVSDAQLDRLLEKGVAENHMHSGVAVTFLSNWDRFMRPLNERVIVELCSFKDKAGNHNAINSKQNVLLIFIANMLRQYLFVSALAATGKKDDEGEKKKNELESNGRGSMVLKKLKSYFIRTFQGDFEKQLNYYVNDNKTCGSMENYFKAKSNEFLKLFGEEITTLQDIWRCLKPDVANLHTSDENIFLYVLVEYIENHGKDSDYVNCPEKYKVIKMLFLNYLRIKNHFYQQVVQQKTIHGLNFFQSEYYRKSSDFSHQASLLTLQNGWERALRVQLQDANLRKLELRISIHENEAEFINVVNAFLKAYLDVLHESYCCFDQKRNQFIPTRALPRVGLVFHFLKREVPNKRCKQSASGKELLHYFELFRSYDRQLDNLLSLRDKSEDFPLDKYLLGIDVASLENEVPTWVFAPIYENARDSRKDPISYGTRDSKSFHSLGFTFHAGEDFRHILSGLRRVHEVVTKLKFHAGDRIGHGIALGLDAKKWSAHNRTVIIPRIEALENYVWAYDMLSNNCDSTALINLDFIEKKIYKLTEEIFGEDSKITINMLIKAYHKLFRDNWFEKPDEEIECARKRLVALYLGQVRSEESDCQSLRAQGGYDIDLLVFARHSVICSHKMNEPIHMKIEEQEVEITCTIQQLVKRAVDEKGIVVEVNPSSNVAIADMDTINENQLFGINNYGYRFDNLLVCINSDDPAVFNTNAANELGYIYFGMLEKNVNRESALQWIDKLRENGMNASFIRRTDSDEQILREMEEYIAEI